MVHACCAPRSYWDGGYYSFHVNQLNASEAGGSENFFLHVTVSRFTLQLNSSYSRQAGPPNAEQTTAR